MKEIETKSWLIISCLLISGIALFVQSDTSENLTSITEENVGRQDDPDNDDSTYWNLVGTGDFTGSISGYTINEETAAGETVTFANLPMDPTNRWYVMNNSAAVPASFTAGSIDLIISYSGQNMIESQSYFLKSWLWSIDENGDMFRHTNYNALDIDLVTGQTSFTDNFSITMIDIPDGISTQVARPNGCYWVEYWVGEKSPQTPGFILPGGKTETVSFGVPCPTNDADGDNWTDVQENIFSSDVNNSNSNPYTVWQSDRESRYSEGYSDGYSDGNASGYADGCEDGGGEMVEINCIPSPWDDSDPADNWDDTSYENGRATGYAAACIELGGTMSNGVCVPPSSSWDDSDPVDNWDDASYNAGVASGDTLHDTICNWDTHTWAGPNADPPCVPIASCDNCPAPADNDGDGVIDIFEDDDCMATPPNSYVDSTGCVDVITIDPTAEPSCPCGEEDGDVNLTGSGDVADLTVIGGAGLLAGIGTTSIISQTGRGPRTSGGGNKKPDIDLDDVGDAFDNLDLDMDADLDMDKPDVAAVKTESMGGSDQYFKSGVERQKAMTGSADPLLDDYTEDESED